MMSYAATYPDTISLSEILAVYHALAGTAELGELTKFGLAGEDEWQQGSYAKLTAAIKRKPKSHYARIAFTTGVELQLVRGMSGKPRWLVESQLEDPDRAFLERMCHLAEAAFDHSIGCTWVGVGRDDTVLGFLPQPPIADLMHVLTTDAEEVEAAYDEPAVFWKQWKTIRERGKSRLCVRATDRAEPIQFLGDVFEGTMAMVRAAKPEKTAYGSMRKWPKDMRAFWQLGPQSEELAGLPALKRVGYDAKTKTLEYSGVLEKTGDEQRHVLVKEIGDLNQITLNKQDEEGRPVDIVRVVFAEKWMAQQERRPLRDNEVRVYYMAGGKLVEVVD